MPEFTYELDVEEQKISEEYCKWSNSKYRHPEGRENIVYWGNYEHSHGNSLP